MFTRRSFFRRFGAMIAVVAIAPEIAFKQELKFSALKAEYGWSEFDAELFIRDDLMNIIALEWDRQIMKSLMP